MTKIRTILRNKRTDKVLETATFERTLNLVELKSHIRNQVRWKAFQILFEDTVTDQIITVDSDELLGHCYSTSGDVISFIVSSLPKGMFSKEVFLLVQEGFSKGLCLGLLKRFDGDVDTVRSELILRRKITTLADEGFARGRCRKFLLKNNGDIEAARSEITRRYDLKGMNELIQEGIPRRSATRLIKRHRGDLHKAREEFFSSKDEQYLEIAEELLSQGFKPKKKIIRLLKKNNGDSQKVKEEMSKKRRRHEDMDSEPRCESFKRKKHLEVHEKQTKVVESTDEIPYSEVRTIYLDGNNMLYIEKEMRDFAIRGQNRIVAEKMLANLVLMYCQRSPDEQNIKLMYDATKLHGYTNFNFEIICARKTGFKIADDALVNICEQNPEIRNTSLFVTSDKELIGRLKSLGSFVMKPKAFLLKIKDLIGLDYDAILQQQMDLLDE